MLLPNSSSPKLLRPIQSDDFLPPISRLLTLSGLFLMSTIGIIITLSAISNYKVSVKAPATIRPTEKVRLIQSDANGKIKEIYVNSNQKINLDDKIASIGKTPTTVQEPQRIIHSNVKGTIQQLNLYPGQSVQRGDTIAQIVPDETSLLVKAYVAVQDINQVKIGQSAQMRISACPYPDYGTLQGTVTTISPDVRGVQSESINGEQEHPIGSASYEVTIQPKTHLLGQAKSLSSLCTLRAGMEGSIDIVSTEETVLQFVLKKARLFTNL